MNRWINTAYQYTDTQIQRYTDTSIHRYIDTRTRYQYTDTPIQRYTDTSIHRYIDIQRYTNQWINESMNQWINESMNQWINESVNQWIHRYNDTPIHRYIEHTRLPASIPHPWWKTAATPRSHIDTFLLGRGRRQCFAHQYIERDTYISIYIYTYIMT